MVPRLAGGGAYAKERTMDTLRSRKPQVLVCQQGARRRYAVPRILEQAGMLEALYTDSSAESFFGKCAGYLGRSAPASMRRLANRNPNGIPSNRICSSDCCMAIEIKRQFSGLSGSSNLLQLKDQRLSRKMKRWGLRGADIIYSMYDESLDFVRWAKSQGAKSVIDVYISPLTNDIVNREYSIFPDWGGEKDRTLLELKNILWRQAVELADLLICPSEWVAEGVRTLTPAAAGKIRIVPYGCSIDYQRRTNQPINGRVLFAGGYALRKGLHYLAQVATRLKTSIPEIDFRIAGMLPQEVVQHPICKDLNFRGKLTYKEMRREFLSADCFVLPSLSEGFAGVVAEAISAGCPVIVTGETGSPVVDGREGIVVPSRNVEVLEEAIHRMIVDRDFRKGCSVACLQQAGFYSEEMWRDRLIPAILEGV